MDQDCRRGRYWIALKHPGAQRTGHSQVRRLDALRARFVLLRQAHLDL